jgi:hypothetical protein
MIFRLCTVVYAASTAAPCQPCGSAALLLRFCHVHASYPQRCATGSESVLQERCLVQPTQRPLTAMPAASSGAADPGAAQQPAAADTSTASSSSDLTATAYPGSEADLQQQEQQQQQQGGGQQGSTVSSSSSFGSTSTSSRGSSIGTVMNSAIPSDQEPDRKLHVPCLAAFHSMIHALAAGGDLRSAGLVCASEALRPSKLHGCIAEG